MGNGPVRSSEVPEILPLPCTDASYWQRIRALALPPRIASPGDLLERMERYCPLGSITGLEAAMAFDWPDSTRPDLFGKVLPDIIQRALDLPDLAAKQGPLQMLLQGRRGQVRIPRQLGASLLSNMFLCTFDRAFDDLPGREAMPSPSFSSLLMATEQSPQEIAKLQMFLHFFDRLGADPLEGEIVIDRVVGVGLQEQDWLDSSQPLLPLEMAPPMMGFEQAPELAHADFANMFIGGGVLSGGCVQEEIRFAICPELCLSMLLCPCMLEDEAIQVVGSQQYSSYSGYAFSLEYGGDHVDQACRAPDGSRRTAVLAMDALDLRGGNDSLAGQMHPKPLLRDLNKSLAAFVPVNEESLQHHPIVATGNWGCGAFGGCAPLKALLQWASSSQCGRRLRYFPFDEGFGPELLDVVRQAVEKQATVGQLLSVLWDFKPGKMHVLPLDQVNAKLQARLRKPARTSRS